MTSETLTNILKVYKLVALKIGYLPWVSTYLRRLGPVQSKK